MPAVITTAIVGACYLAVWALCRTARDADDRAAVIHLEEARARARERHASNVVPFPARRPFDWEHDA